MLTMDFIAIPLFIPACRKARPMPIGKTMILTPELLQFVGSLVAILALAGLAYALKLGGASRLASEDDARAAANEAVDGFAAVTLAIDKDGNGAILRDAAGQVLILKPHGNKLAGRLLTANSFAQAREGALVIDSGERRFGSAILEIDAPQTWAEAINRLEK
jgi:hypothetical protein